MLENNSHNPIPSIGEIVHYHPDNETRHAAIVVEVHVLELNEDSTPKCPNISIQVLKPNGKMAFESDVPFVPDDESLSFGQSMEAAGQIAGCWSFINTIALQTPGDESELVGTKANWNLSMI